MGIYNKTITGLHGVNFTKEVDGPTDYSGLTNNTYFKDLSDGLPYWKNASGTVISLFSESTVIDLGNILYVTSTGDDSTAERGNLAKPYASIDGVNGALSDATTGDTIVVLCDLTITATTSTGIWKNGVNYEFKNNCTITKNSAGALFGFSTPTIDFSLKGNARFVLGGSVGYFASGSALPINIDLEYDSLTQSAYNSYSLYTTNSKTIRLKYNSNTNTSGAIYQTIGGGKLFIDFVKDTATLNWWLSLRDDTKFNIKGTEVICSSSNAVISTYLTEGTFDITWCEGAPYAYDCVTNPYNAYGAIRIIGRANYINNNHTDVTHVGSTNYLRNYGTGSIKAGRVHLTTTVLGGEVEITKSGFYTTIVSSIVISGGYCKVKLEDAGYAPSIVSNGGTVEIESSSANFSNGYGSVATINAGGKVIVNGDINYATSGSSYVYNYEIFNLNGGTLDLRNCKINQRASDSDKIVGTNTVSCIKWVSGKLIVNGATLKNTIPEVPVIRATTSGLNIKVLSGGLSTNNVTNGGTLTGKKQKVKFNISTTGATTTTINGTLHTATVLTTKATIAQDLVTLINAGAQNGVVIATQDIPGTDEYFYVEALVDGVAYTYTYSNITETQIRPNSYAITNIIGGTIIDDVDVE